MSGAIAVVSTPRSWRDHSSMYKMAIHTIRNNCIPLAAPHVHQLLQLLQLLQHQTLPGGEGLARETISYHAHQLPHPLTCSAARNCCVNSTAARGVPAMCSSRAILRMAKVCVSSLILFGIGEQTWKQQTGLFCFGCVYV